VTHCARHPFETAVTQCGRCGRPLCGRCAVPTPGGVRCPECAAHERTAGRPTAADLLATDPEPSRGGGLGGRPDADAGSSQPQPQQPRRFRPVATLSLIGANLLVGVASIASSGSLAAIAGGSLGGLLGGVTPLIVAGGLQVAPTVYSDVGLVPGVAGGEWWRLITSMFLHFGLVHLAMNMLALWFTGPDLEYALGRGRFVALYLLSGLGGSAAVMLSGTDSITAGASGAVFGLFAALVIVLRRIGRSAAGVLPVLLVNLVVTFAVPGISIAGHLGGLVAGAVVAWALTTSAARRSAAARAAIVAALLVVVLALSWLGAQLASG
jgi:membrane associated rhomboid family serine protease